MYVRVCMKQIVPASDWSIYSSICAKMNGHSLSNALFQLLSSHLNSRPQSQCVQTQILNYTLFLHALVSVFDVC